MKVAFVEIQNFRKLKACRIDFSEKITLFVGANNSGKTSAMEALIRFLKERNKFICTDFTLSNWEQIESIGNAWGAESSAPSDLNAWYDVLPSLDLWFEAELNDLRYIFQILPSLQWRTGLLGIRLRLQPKDIQMLFKDYREAMADAQNLRAAAQGANIKALPNNLSEFLEKEGQIGKYFQIVAYLLDPAKAINPKDSVAQPQALPPNAFEIHEDLLKGLVKIDIINAQRGLSDDNSSEAQGESASGCSLSSQLKRYYQKHIDPMDRPEAGDLTAIQLIEKAQDDFDAKLNADFNPAFQELQNLGYPGFSDPQITLSSKLQPMEALNHDTAVQYDVIQGGSSSLRLPEKYNGLGYQNLVSMVFKLIQFRDEWMRVGKLQTQNSTLSAIPIEPIHLVLVEEPEAHLHAQVQQVFINKAYSILRSHDRLGERKEFVSQMIVSTHSSHVAHECHFSDLRYFHRSPATDSVRVPTTHIVNLREIFGANNRTDKFVTRYLKATHCDLFFADAAILVEGAAERILLPGLIREHFPELTSRYLTILEIGGSHAYRLRPLIEALAIPTLVITDLDATDAEGNAIQPQPGQNQKTGNTTLKKWLPEKEQLDDLYAVAGDQKVSENRKVRIAFQTPFDVTFNGTTAKVYPYTFEDAVILKNFEKIKPLEATTGLLKEAIKYANSKQSIADIAKGLFATLRKGSKSKAEFALELLCIDENNTIQIPSYIKEGLEWLKKQFDKPGSIAP